MVEEIDVGSRWTSAETELTLRGRFLAMLLVIVVYLALIGGVGALNRLLG